MASSISHIHRPLSYRSLVPTAQNSQTAQWQTAAYIRAAQRLRLTRRRALRSPCQPAGAAVKEGGLKAVPGRFASRRNYCLQQVSVWLNDAFDNAGVFPAAFPPIKISLSSLAVALAAAAFDVAATTAAPSRLAALLSCGSCQRQRVIFERCATQVFEKQP